MEHKDLQKKNNKYIRDLEVLKNKYIRELEVLRKDLSPQTERKKKVRFSSGIEHIGGDGPCACDLECILEDNKWECRRRDLFI